MRIALASVCIVLPLGAAGAAHAEQAPPKTPTAAERLAKASEQLEQAGRLQDNGFEEDARKLVKEAVQQSKVEVPSRLRSPEQRLGWWREALGIGGPVVRTALEILALALALVLVGLLIATAIKALVLRFSLSARLEGFAGSSDATVAPLLGAALSEALERMSDDTSGRRLTWMSGTEPKFELPTAITEAVPSAGLLSGLVQMLDKLLYRNLYLVSGTVHPPHEHRGAGITLTLSNRSGSQSEQVTVWEREFMLKEAGETAKEAVRYERLILPVAIWLGYRPMLQPKKGQRSPLGVGNWRSYALFAIGELVPDPAQQRLLYERALDLDGENLGARLNLANLLLQRPVGQVQPDGEHEQVRDGSSEGWLERLERAGVDLELVAASTSAAGQPIWFRGRYMEAIRRLYLAQAAGGDANARAAQAAAAKSALDELSRAMAADAAVSQLDPLMRALESPVRILRASIELVQTGSAEDRDAVTASGSEWLSASGEYNVACFWARCADAPAYAAERAALVASSVKALRRAIVREGDMAAEARVDPAFDPIREEAAFEAVVQDKPGAAKEAEEPSRCAITLDPGPQLLGLVGRGVPQ